MSVSIVFNYSNDPLVIAALGGFNVYATDDGKERLSGAIFVPGTNIPTVTNPLILAMPPGATQVEVVPIDSDGYEGTTSYLRVEVGLPAVLALAQIVMVVTEPSARSREGESK